MASWAELEFDAPELAARAQRCFDAHGHKTIATLRLDGSPRICGTELVSYDGQLWLAGMPGALRFADLRRDPRFALHSGSDEPEVWRTNPDKAGDAKVAGTAQEITDAGVTAAVAAAISADAPPKDHAAAGSFELFRLDITEIVVVRVIEDHLLIESWHEGQGVRRAQR
ncbi:MAG: pyridoxamine 5'-phosphate oxidase family protein [Geodermatophilaceae bacterium]|jgi:hypothetical protein|nr:pyridoxamine 5'-phosphate oxidase family protein [Geodermatophilaceae bacterium]MDQ3463355.1 pyridoxamine 5'-phosphate oxidase family protein [Actinomycetota bacterium]